MGNVCGGQILGVDYLLFFHQGGDHFFGGLIDSERAEVDLRGLGGFVSEELLDLGHGVPLDPELGGHHVADAMVAEFRYVGFSAKFLDQVGPVWEVANSEARCRAATAFPG